MKLVNPAGRSVSTFDTQANACRCICSSNSSNTYSYAYYTATCICQCEYGTTNRDANYTISNNNTY